MIKKRNELLNIMEAVAAFFVVFIHFKFPGRIGNIVVALARVSVPFFFCISGYFFYRNDTKEEIASIPRKIKRLLLLMIFSESVYFVFYWLLQIDNHGFTLQALMNVIELEVCRPYYAELINKLAIFAPPLNGIFWFVGSLVVVYMCIYFVVKHSKQNLALAISLILLVLGFLLRRILYYTGVDTPFPYERLIPFLPFPFFMIGYHLRKLQGWFDRVDDRLYYSVFVVGVILTFIEQFGGVHTLYIGTLILVPSMILYGGKHRNHTVNSLAERLLSHIGANTATYIYMLHMLIGNVTSVLVSRLLPIRTDGTPYAWLVPILVCVISAVCGEVFYVIKRVIIKTW